MLFYRKFTATKHYSTFMKTLFTFLAVIFAVFSNAQTQAPVTMGAVSNSTSNTQVSQNELLQNSGLLISGSSFNGGLPSTAPATGVHTCGAFDLNQQHYASRGLLNEFNQSSLDGAEAISTSSATRTPGINTISVIFHVVHNTNNPAENVSAALIAQVYNDLVEDYQLLNANAANARTGAPFNFVPADANINFCLATQDEFGTPLGELGVIRVATSEEWYDSNGGEENKMKASATGGSQIWDRNNYLNIWICDISNGAGSGTAGYAYRPTPTLLPSSNIDGIVLDYNLGMNNENVLTHEVGHYLGLDHTWGGSGGCSNDDGFTDTPNTLGPSQNYPGTCTGQTLCGAIETQYENYMDYANCTVMFTQNQADYMLSILQGIRNSLLISPGCDPTNTPPNSDFTSIPLGPSPVIVPVNGAVSFFDQSTNVPTGWTWALSGAPGVDWNYIGGTTAASQDPQVEFYTVGFYDVTLTASNGFGPDLTPAIELNYVQVVAPAAGTACDTLRNWDPADQPFSFYNVTPTNGAWGYIPGSNLIDLYGNGSSMENTLQYAEQFSYAGVAEVRRVRLPIFIATDVAPTGGSIELRVYDDDNGANPGTILATETILLSDMTTGAFNEFDFTTPASVSGTFFVGFELPYAAAQDTLLFGLTNTIPLGTPGFFMEMDTYGWLNSPLLGLTESIAIDVMLSNGPAPVAAFTATGDSICDGGSISVNGSGSTNVTDYFWYLTDNPFTTILSTSGTPTNVYSPSPAGNYSIYLFGDGSCMTDAVILDIVVADPVSATVTPSTTTCGLNDGSITISAMTGGNGAYSYSLDGVNYQPSPFFGSLPAGSYDVYVATIGDMCETMYTVVIGSSTGFTAGISPNISICPGGTIAVTASGGTTYQWFDGATPIGGTPSINVTPGTTTQYTCLVTNGVGCQSTVYVTVTLFVSPVAPVITASGSTTICAGTSVDLTSSYPTSNVWSTSELSSTITVSTAGPYTVTYTDGNGCTNISLVTTIIVNAAPTISAGTITDPTTCGTATGSIQVSGTGTGDVSWTGTASGSASSVPLPYVITGLAAGAYNITFTDGNGCVSNLLAQGINDPTPPVTPTITQSGAITFCVGGSVDLTSSYASGNAWTNSEVTQTITVTTSGSYSVTYTDPSGCSSTSLPVVVTVNALPAAPIITPSGPTTFCEGGTVQLTSSQGSGNVWSTAESTQDIDVTTTGSFTVTYTDGNGCSATSAAIVVTVNALPIVTQTPFANVCLDETSFALSGATPAGGTYSGTGVAAGNFDPGTAGLGTHVITYTYTDGNGCENTAVENILVDACLSVEEYINDNIKVFPNPLTNELNVQFDGDFDLTIYDARGRIVYSNSGTDLLTINTSLFEAAVYMVNVSSESINAVIRVVKQ
ncbi:MAG: hypothetical protein ACI837_000222 [Crocinitomicaceae bacterium]|jgi:hypothetical protein